VTPLGNPVRLTDTRPENPFRLEIEAVKLAFELPASAVTEVGVRTTLKSGAGVIVNPRFAEFVKAPDVPPTVTV